MTAETKTKITTKRVKRLQRYTLILALLIQRRNWGVYNMSVPREYLATFSIYLGNS